MSLINSNINRYSRQDGETNLQEQEVSEEESNQFISIYQRFNQKVTKQIQSHKKMDMVYNYMVKNDIKTEKKSEQKDQKRKTRKDKEGRKYICGACKLGYLSYPALYTHIKTKHNSQTPEGTIRGQSGKPKKRGRPKVRKTPQIYERELQKNEFPKNLTNLVPKQSLQVLQKYQDIELGEQQLPEISLKYFVGIVRDLKKMQQARIYLLPIHQVITTFLDNITQYVNQQNLLIFQEMFFEFIGFVNRKYQRILGEYQNITNYYVNCQLNEGEFYCEVERPYFIPVFAQQFIKYQLNNSEDEEKQILLIDFCKWLHAQQLTEIKLMREGGGLVVNKE